MRGAIPPFPQYAFIEWYSVKAQGQTFLRYLYGGSKFSSLYSLVRKLIMGSTAGVKALVACYEFFHNHFQNTGCGRETGDQIINRQYKHCI
jgi:hypothetical protein